MTTSRTTSRFRSYPSTANLKHVRPSSVAAIGTKGDAANHQYDLADFFAALDAGHFPAVAFLKPAAYQNGHAGYSDPIDEQAFLVRVLNDLQRRPEWASTAVFVTWDDSDGWYDHLMGPIVNSSVGPIDVLNGDGICGDGTSILPGVAPATHHALGRCGYGPRLPLLAISPWARRNYVDSTVTDLTSILRFIEDVFLDGRRIGGGSFDAIAGTLNHLFDFTKTPDLAPLVLDERTGAEVQAIAASQPDSMRIGPVDLFGTAGIDVAAVRARLPLHSGDAISETATTELRAKIQSAVTEVTGRAATDIAAVCCTPKGELMVYLGLPGANNHTIQHQPAPTGATCLAANGGRSLRPRRRCEREGGREGRRGGRRLARLRARAQPRAAPGTARDASVCDQEREPDRHRAATVRQG